MWVVPFVTLFFFSPDSVHHVHNNFLLLYHPLLFLGTMLLWHPLSLNIFHWCLLRSQTFAGTGRFLANVNRFRANGRNWFRSELFELSFMTWCGTGECGWSHMQTDGVKLVMQPEADVGSVTVHQTVNYHWPHLVSPTLAWQLSEFMFW